jgi:ATP-binding protein involved in chromosome partitioning
VLLQIGKSTLSKKVRTSALTPQTIPGIQHVVAVASGKEGVGKSTVAVNLAAALAKSGLRVGLLDADIHGPNVPRMLGLKQLPPAQDGKIRPAEAYGIKVISLAFAGDSSPTIWRGPMIDKAIQQFLFDVSWGELDVLVVDLPPGTGDAQLSLTQRIPVDGVVIVSTPQLVALDDARKGIAMFQKVDVPVLGLVENMSFFQCPDCGSVHHIFGHGGAVKLAVELDLPLLAEIPLEPLMREDSDSGLPAVLDPQSGSHRVFQGLAETVCERLGILQAVAEVGS